MNKSTVLVIGGLFLVGLVILSFVNFLSFSNSYRINSERSAAIADTERYSAQTAEAAAVQSIQATMAAVEAQSTQAANQAISTISVTVTNNHCKGYGNCADFTITVENGAIASEWPTFYFRSGKTSVGYCNYFTKGISCFFNEHDLNSDPATKVCIDIYTGIERETAQICKDITN